MSKRPQRRKSAGVACAGALGFLLALTACGDAGSSGSGAASEPTGKYQEIRALLPERIRESGKIVVANPLHNPPYAFQTADGEELKGIAPDLAEELEPIFGVEFDWSDTAFPSLIPGLQAHRFDMIWGSVTDTVEREQVITFVDYHMDGGLFLVPQGNRHQIEGIGDICGKNIGALKGSFQIELLEEQSQKCVQVGRQKANIRIYPGVSEAYLSVRSGQTAAFFAGVGAARYNAKQRPDTFETAGPIYAASPYGAGFAKDDMQLAKAFQAGLEELIDSGAYEKVLERYGMGVTALSADEILINGAEELSAERLTINGENS